MKLKAKLIIKFKFYINNPMMLVLTGSLSNESRYYVNGPVFFGINKQFFVKNVDNTHENTHTFKLRIIRLTISALVFNRITQPSAAFKCLKNSISQKDEIYCTHYIYLLNVSLPLIYFMAQLVSKLLTL